MVGFKLATFQSVVQRIEYWASTACTTATGPYKGLEIMVIFKCLGFLYSGPSSWLWFMSTSSRPFILKHCCLTGSWSWFANISSQTLLLSFRSQTLIVDFGSCSFLFGICSQTCNLVCFPSTSYDNCWFSQFFFTFIIVRFVCRWWVLGVVLQHWFLHLVFWTAVLKYP